MSNHPKDNASSPPGSPEFVDSIRHRLTRVQAGIALIALIDTENTSETGSAGIDVSISIREVARQAFEDIGDIITEALSEHADAIEKRSVV